MAFKYSLKVWGFTLITGTITLMTSLGFYNHSNLIDAFDSLPIFLLIFVVATVLAIPSLFLLWVVVGKGNSILKSVFARKLLLILAGIFFIFLTFFVIDRNLLSHPDLQAIFWPFSYCLSLIIWTASFRLPSSPQQ
ncbi:MAG: hypothetical protein KGM98_07085 [Bacteroidota bacterium]|nr:hypothetical protein [Bacteroidota bacterium]